MFRKQLTIQYNANVMFGKSVTHHRQLVHYTEPPPFQVIVSPHCIKLELAGRLEMDDNLCVMKL